MIFMKEAAYNPDRSIPKKILICLKRQANVRIATSVARQFGNR
jgi:hypothetical protein